MQKKYVKVLSNIFYELTPLTNDIICLKLYSDGENILASFCHTNTLIMSWLIINYKYQFLIFSKQRGLV